MIDYTAYEIDFCRKLIAMYEREQADTELLMSIVHQELDYLVRKRDEIHCEIINLYRKIKELESDEY